jgi:hypothetical protein
MPTDHAINLKRSYTLPCGRVYNLSDSEVNTLKVYIETNLTGCFIQRLSSLAAALMLYTEMTESGHWTYGDYRALNLGTVTYRYPLSRISEQQNHVHDARIFSKPKLRNFYHPIQAQQGDKLQSLFRTCYGQFEYQVIPFRISITPATFQAYINNCLQSYIDNSTLYYLYTILSY